MYVCMHSGFMCGHLLRKITLFEFLGKFGNLNGSKQVNIYNN